MPKCPECGRNIDFLNYVCVEESEYLFTGNDYNYENSELIEDKGYFCPKCFEYLFGTKEEAKRFLFSDPNDLDFWEE